MCSWMVESGSSFHQLGGPLQLGERLGEFALPEVQPAEAVHVRGVVGGKLVGLGDVFGCLVEVAVDVRPHVAQIVHRIMVFRRHLDGFVEGVVGGFVLAVPLVGCAKLEIEKMGEPVLLAGLGQFLGVEQVLDGLGILVEGTVGESGVKLGDEPGLELLAGLLERGEGDGGLVLKQPHAGQLVIGQFELGVDLEDGLEVGGRLVEFVELALDAAKHEQRALVGGALA